MSRFALAVAALGALTWIVEPSQAQSSSQFDIACSITTRASFMQADGSIIQGNKPHESELRYAIDLDRRAWCVVGRCTKDKIWKVMLADHGLLVFEMGKPKRTVRDRITFDRNTSQYASRLESVGSNPEIIIDSTGPCRIEPYTPFSGRPR